MITDIRSIYYLHYLCLLPLLLLVACSNKQGNEPTPTPASVLAFPGADGAGRYATGGRGSAVYVVNSLEDNVNDVKIGTLRKAIQATGNRIIVFTVSGRIKLSGELPIKSGNVTIMGQSAPGDGICISGYPMVIKSSNVILRFLRFRMGDEHAMDDDALTVARGCNNIIIDHCSCSWSTDECFSIYGGDHSTVQYCFITESLRNSKHDKGQHGYGGIWGGKNISFHHNLLAHHDSRNPRFDHDYVTPNITNTQMYIDFINNVVYNWGSNSAYGGESSNNSGNLRCINYINNYYKPGPATGKSKRDRLLNPTDSCGECLKAFSGSVILGAFYLTGNHMDGSSLVTADNWRGIYPQDEDIKAKCKSDKRFTFTNAYINEQSAIDAYEAVLSKAGCALHRDTIDARIVNEVRNGSYTYNGSNGSTKGLIDSQTDVRGWPEYATYDVKTDTDRDNISDDWEVAHGLNPNDPLDAKDVSLQSPYMNIEVYLNDLVKHLY